MDYKKLLVDSGKRMVASGLTVETWGNISARDPETGLVYLTPSGMPYDTITEDDIVVMNEKGETVEGFRRPTIEWEMHLEIMRRRSDVNAIIHTHPVYSQVFGLLHEDIPPVIDEAAQSLGTVRCAEYGLPGSHELAMNAADAIGEKGHACLIANHGAVCAGADMEKAFRVCKVLEMTAQIYCMARAIGNPVPESPETVAAQLELLKDYGQPKK